MNITTASLAAQALWAIKPLRPDDAACEANPWSSVIDALSGVARCTPSAWPARRTVHRMFSDATDEQRAMRLDRRARKMIARSAPSPAAQAHAS